MNRTGLTLLALLAVSPLTCLPARAQTVYATNSFQFLGHGLGALVCPSAKQAQAAYQFMLDDWHHRLLRNSGVGRLDEDINGRYVPFDPERFGCVVAPPGTALFLDTSRLLHVSGQLPDGRQFEGQTLGGMFAP